MPQFSRFASKNSLTVSKSRREILAAVYKFQGTVSGYTSGGSSPSIVDTVDKFPFASNANAADVGNLTQARSNPAGQSSDVSGYTSGGFAPSNANVIDKFPFASDANANDVGDLSQARQASAGQSSDSNGYTSGGGLPLANIIDKFSFASDTNATDVGDLTQGRYKAAGQSSSSNGYTSGGRVPTFPIDQAQNTIDKFPFASDANATDVGDLTQPKNMSAGQSSETHGYVSGGTLWATSVPYPNYVVNVIEKFPFSSDANATDVGDLTVGRYGIAGQSSDVSGYSSGGYRSSPPPPTILNTIDKFPFSSDANATDVGDLTQARLGVAGQQV
jgi:hypothetical protein